MTTDSRPQLRIVFLTSGGLNGAAVLARLLAAPAISLAGVVQSTRVLRATQGPLAGARQLLSQCGWRYAAYLGASTWFADTMLGMFSDRSVIAECRRRRIPLLRTRQVNGPDSIDWMRAQAPDLVVSAFFNQRIGAGVTRLARFGAVNVHPGALPQFRGVDPVFFARLSGAPAGNVTLHRITDDLDCGPVLASDEINVANEASVFHTTAACYQRGAGLLLESIGAICADVPGTPQEGTARYDSWPTREQVGAFHAGGHRLVTTRDIVRLARGHFPGESS